MRGYNVILVASSFHYTKYIETKNFAHGYYLNEEQGKVKFLWIKTFAYHRNDFRRFINMLSFAWRFYTMPAAMIGRPDIIIGSSVHLFAPLAAYFKAKKLGARFILEIRDLWPETLIQLGWKRYNPFILLLGWMERFLYKKAEKIIMLFPLAYQYVESLKIGIPSNKIIWIPNGVTCADFEVNEISDDVAGQLEFLKRPGLKVINAGALGNVYALEHLIEAMHILRDKDITLFLVGNGPLEDSLKNQVTKLGLQNVVFKDAMPKSMMPYLLKSVDVCYASLMNSKLYKYGMSLNKLYDYMAAGRPVVFAVESANNPVDESGCGITVKPNQAQEIAAAFLQLSQMTKAERELLGNQGREYAMKHYDSKLLVDKLESQVLSEAVS